MKATKKLIGAFVALIAALAVSVGATFAWFTSSNTAKVNQFEMEVMSSDGDLFIGTETGKLSQGSVNITVPGSLKLRDVTKDEDGSLKKRADNTPGGEASTSATKGTDYLQFQLFFKSTSALDIYLNTGTQVTCTPDTLNDLQIFDTTVLSKLGTNYGTEIVEGKLAASADNALRIAFSETETLSDAKIWEPGSNKGYWQNNLAADYEDFLQNGTWPEAAGTPNAATEVVGTITGLGTTQESAKLLTLEENVEKSIYVTIWLEGTDGDCLNSIFKDTLQTVLAFVGQAPAV